MGFHMLGSLLSNLIAAREQRLMADQTKRLALRGYAFPKPDHPVAAIKALTEPTPPRVQIVERETGIGWGTVVVAVILGGMFF